MAKTMGYKVSSELKFNKILNDFFFSEIFRSPFDFHTFLSHYSKPLLILVLLTKWKKTRPTYCDLVPGKTNRNTNGLYAFLLHSDSKMWHQAKIATKSRLCHIKTFTSVNHIVALPQR